VTSCSELSLALGEPLAGTAPYARSWLLIEEPRAWERKAVEDAGFGRLEARAKEAGTRVGLIRRFGRAAARGPRTVFRVSCERPEPFVERLSEPDLDARGERVDGPLYLVCTNGRRDMCCGRAGRELARSLAPELGEHLWETTHVGGHRFAPNLVCLPHGLVYGRVDLDAARHVIREYEQGRVELEHLRGRTSLEPEAQARDYFARRATGVLDLDENPAEALPLSVEPELLDPRPESCGGEPKRPVAWRLLSGYSPSPR
jgi:sucrase/ferredoxin-like protein